MQYSRRRLNWLRGILGVASDGPSWALPELPAWNGLGPLLWRKSQELVRCRKIALCLAVLVSVGFTGICIFLARIDAGMPDTGFRPWHVIFLAQIFTLLAILFSRFADFRSDGDKMEVLLALPVSALKLIAAEIIPSVICFSILLVGLECIGWRVYLHYRPWGEMAPYVLWAFLLVPLTVSVFALTTNIIALLFPLPGAASGRVVLNLLTQYGAEILGSGY